MAGNVTTLYRVRTEDGQVLFDDIDHTDRVSMPESVWLLAGEPERLEVVGSDLTVPPGTAIVPPVYPVSPDNSALLVWHVTATGTHLADGIDCHCSDPPIPDGPRE